MVKFFKPFPWLYLSLFNLLIISPLLLPDLDSNQDNQIQRLMYYHYTIGQ